MHRLCYLSFLLLFYTGCCCCSGFGGSTTSGVTTVSEADAAFKEAATEKGERSGVSAKMLIDLRRDDDWSWSQLDDEVSFQFSGISDEYSQWKTDCQALGDE